MRKASVQLQKMFAILLAVTLLLGACQTAPPGPVVEPQGTSQPAAPTQEPAQGRPLPSKSAPTEAQPSPSTVPTEASQDTGLFFAKFNEPPVQAQASLNQEPIASDLRNVDNPFVLSSEQIQRLAQDGFVVTPGTEKEFFTVYEKARYDNVPAFVTSDSLLHSYHLLFDKVLRSAEVRAEPFVGADGPLIPRPSLSFVGPTRVLLSPGATVLPTGVFDIETTKFEPIDSDGYHSGRFAMNRAGSELIDLESMQQYSLVPDPAAWTAAPRHAPGCAKLPSGALTQCPSAAECLRIPGP